MNCGTQLTVKMMQNFKDDFAVFILTHGRADNVKTFKTLERCGYTGKVYLVIDNEDEQENRYRELYGDIVMQFDKLAQAKKTDTADLSTNRGVIIFARNYCFELAAKLGLKYFIELDDDYNRFEFRYTENNKLQTKEIKNLDKVFEAMTDFLVESGALTVAMAQGGDFVGGGFTNKNFSTGLLRKAMNSFICAVDNPFQFVGRINEDVNTYTTLGSRGKLIFTITAANLVQTQTQANAGGMTGTYLDSGTYVKSFYSVIFAPSCVKIRAFGNYHRRIHHNVAWANCVPCIIDEKYKKAAAK